jgi:hypothetical protein
MNMSDYFDVSIDLNQGEPLSPLLFFLFLKDFNDLSEGDLNQLSMYMSIFAVDIVLFTTNAASLQAQLDCIYQYSIKGGLKINTKKSKVCICEKRKQSYSFEWFINGEKLEIVDHFCYLGVNFIYTWNMKNAIKVLCDQALKAYYCLLSLFTRVNLDIKTKLSLFDSLVLHILLYASEMIWGIYEFKEIDKLHIKFCKHTLGVQT